MLCSATTKVAIYPAHPVPTEQALVHLFALTLAARPGRASKPPRAGPKTRGSAPGPGSCRAPGPAPGLPSHRLPANPGPLGLAPPGPLAKRSPGCAGLPRAPTHQLPRHGSYALIQEPAQRAPPCPPHFWASPPWLASTLLPVARRTRKGLRNGASAHQGRANAGGGYAEGSYVHKGLPSRERGELSWGPPMGLFRRPLPGGTAPGLSFRSTAARSRTPSRLTTSWVRPTHVPGRGPAGGPRLRGEESAASVAQDPVKSLPVWASLPGPTC